MRSDKLDCHVITGFDKLRSNRFEYRRILATTIESAAPELCLSSCRVDCRDFYEECSIIITIGRRSAHRVGSKSLAALHPCNVLFPAISIRRVSLRLTYEHTRLPQPPSAMYRFLVSVDSSDGLRTMPPLDGTTRTSGRSDSVHHCSAL